MRIAILPLLAFCGAPLGAAPTPIDDAVRRATAPAWIGWTAPAVAGHRLCCSWDRERCDLDDRGFSVEDRADGGALQVLVKVGDGRAQRVRALSASCSVRAKDQPVAWLEGVSPEDSVAWLGAMAGGAGSGPAEEALGALAFHDHPAADATLARLAGTKARHEIRKKAAFWLGVARGRAGYEHLVALARDADPDFREELAFAISRSAEPEAVDTLIGLARRDPSPEVRRKALFWLGQAAGERARAALGDAIEDDPETEVKQAAVFALSQLPGDEAVPALIHVAETHRNAEVRRKAMFWLGQSGDPRALAYFEKILSR